MKMKKRFFGILLTLVMVLGLMPGMSMTAYAAETTVTWTDQTFYDHPTNGEYRDGFTTEGVTLTTEGNSNADVRDGNYFYGRNYNSFSVSDGKKLTKIVIESGGSQCELNDFPGATVTSHVLTAEEIRENYPDIPDDEIKYYVGFVRINTITWTGNAETVRFKAWISSVTKITFTIEPPTVDVTGVTLSPSTAQTIDVDGKVSFTATVSPDNAADKTVKWSVGGTDTGAVKLYSDEACTTEVGANATETLTVYAKGISAGSATVTATSNADSTKSATCAVTVTEPDGGVTAPTSKVLSGNGQPQPLVNAGTVSGGTLEYALGMDANTAPADGWSTEIPTATEAGTYYVWYRIKGDANHNDVAPACVVVTIEAPAATPAAPESVSDYTLLASMKTSGNKAFKLKWTAVTGAEGYDVFLGDCGGGECELKKTVTGLSCKIGKLKKGNAYKAFVNAWKTENGQKVYIGEASPDVHAVAGGKSNKFTNAKKITVKKKNLTVAVGGSKKIKASLKKFSNSRRYLNHTAKIRYFSSNRAVATVNAKGKVTGVAPGTCTVYAVAENGLRKGVKITVK